MFDVKVISAATALSLAGVVGAVADSRTVYETVPMTITTDKRAVAQPCLNCGDTPYVRPQAASAATLYKPAEQGGKCSKFSPVTTQNGYANAAGPSFSWIDQHVNIDTGVRNWIAHYGPSGAQAYINAYCASNPDPAGFPHHINFARSCSLVSLMIGGGSTAYHARYTGCTSKEQAAKPGKYVGLFMDEKPAEIAPCLNCGTTTGGVGPVEGITVPATVRR